MGDLKAMKTNCLLLIALFGAQVFAQAPPEGLPEGTGNAPEGQSVDVVLTVEHDEAPRWIFFVFRTVSPCEQAAEVNNCAGSFRDIAICLAESNTELEPACEQELLQAAMEHADIEVLNLLVTRDFSLVPAAKEAEAPPAMDEHTEEHHGHDQSITQSSKACVKHVTASSKVAFAALPLLSECAQRSSCDVSLRT